MTNSFQSRFKVCGDRFFEAGSGPLSDLPVKRVVCNSGISWNIDEVKNPGHKPGHIKNNWEINIEFEKRKIDPAPN